MLGEACATTLPPDLRDIAIGANSCRVCERTSEQHLQICNGCKVVRYCGPECQRIDFSKHRLVCSRLFDAIGRHKGRRKQLETKVKATATVEGSETFRSIVTRSVLLNSGRDCHDPSSSTAGPRAEPQVDTQWDGWSGDSWWWRDCRGEGAWTPWDLRDGAAHDERGYGQ